MLIKEIEKQKIRFKRKISYSDKLCILPIKYNNDDELIVQTPVLFCPFGEGNYNSLDISLLNSEDNVNIKDLEALLEYIDALFEKKYKRKYNSFIIKDSFYPARIRTHINKECVYFDEHSKMVNIGGLEARTHAKFLLHFKELWVKKDKYGVNIDVIQVKIYKLDKEPPKDYSFIDSDTEDDPDADMPEKYKKMIKVGIPREAVLLKMERDKTLGGITGGKIVLKKTAPIERKKEVVPCDKPRISLKEILGAINKLKIKNNSD